MQKAWSGTGCALSMKSKKHIAEVAGLFLKLGFLGFGGPAVHIAMMEEEVVRKRRWLSQEQFLDLVGATNLIPGPNSTEMTMHCGYERAGRMGLVVAGLCFIVPAVVITGILAWAYKAYGTLPQVEPFIYGIKPAVIAVIVSLMIALGRKALKNVELAVTGVLAAGLALYGISEILILFGGGLFGIALYLVKNRDNRLKSLVPLPLLADLHVTPGHLKIFWIFLKTGAILYGSGYVLFAFLDEELVKTGMLTQRQLTDAIAAGQFTPGPVFSSATFIGWQLAGLPGAVLATIGIFLPSFLFVAFLNPLLPVLRRSQLMSVFLDTVNVISVALILSVCVEMGKAAIADWRTITIAVLGFIVSMRFKKLNSAWVILGGAVLGYLLF